MCIHNYGCLGECMSLHFLSSHFQIHQTLFANAMAYGDSMVYQPIWLCSLPLAWLAHTSQSIRHYLHSTYRSPEPIVYHAYTHMGTLWYTNMAMFFVPVLSSPHFPIHQTLFYSAHTQWPQPIAHHAYTHMGDSMIYQYGYVLCP